jgi:branched-chain amino acid aminotransferase
MTTEDIFIPVEKTTQSKLKEIDFNNIPFGKNFTDHMFVAEFSDDKWHSTKIVPYEKLSIAPSSAVLHYGQAIFEGMKAYKNENGEIMLFRAIDNYKRFVKSAERMAMPIIPEELFMEAVKKLVLLEADWIPTKEGSSLYIRPFMYGADEFLGVRSSDKFKFLVITSPTASYYPKPLKVKNETRFTRAAEGGVGSAKASGNYGGSLAPYKSALKQGYDQLIWTDAREHKYVEESGTMNLFFVINDVLVTPPLGSTILAGVTRQSVITLAKDMGMNVEERRISIDEIEEGLKNGNLTDAFGTGTAATIAQIRTIGFENGDLDVKNEALDTFSIRVNKELEKIRTGLSFDKHGWVVKLN